MKAGVFIPDTQTFVRLAAPYLRVSGETGGFLWECTSGRVRVGDLSLRECGSCVSGYRALCGVEGE